MSQTIASSATQTTAETTTETPVILRLLGGMLRGAEFALECGVTLLVLSPPEMLLREDGQASFPDNAIFIPVEKDGGNFEIEVAPQQQGAPLVAIRDLRFSSNTSNAGADGRAL